MKSNIILSVEYQKSDKMVTLIRLTKQINDYFLSHRGSVQMIDPMADFFLPQLQSALIPCTRTSSSLSFKYSHFVNINFVSHTNSFLKLFCLRQIEIL